MTSWIVVLQSDWDRPAESWDDAIPYTSPAAFGLDERELEVEGSETLAEFYESGLELDYNELSAKLDELNVLKAPLEESLARRLAEVRADDFELRAWRLSPSKHRRALLGLAAQRLRGAIQELNELIDWRLAQRETVLGWIVARSAKRGRELFAALAEGKRLREEALALDPKVETRFHAKPFSKGDA